MTDTLWNHDNNVWDINAGARNRTCEQAQQLFGCGAPKNDAERMAMFFRFALKTETRLKEQLIDTKAFLWLSDYVWLRTGQKRWFVDHATAEVLREIAIEDENITGIKLPYDVFNIVFERGTTGASGLPLRWLRVAFLTSAISARVLQEVNVHGTTGPPRLLLVADCGEDVRTHRYAQDTPSEHSKVAVMCRSLEEMPPPESLAESIENSAALSDAMKIATSALLLYAARPELIVDCTIPRSSRYGFKPKLPEGGKAVRIVHLMPTWKIVDNRSTGIPTGQETAPHFRAGFFRTYRHERYRRNADGSLVVQWINPTAVHADVLLPDTNSGPPGDQ